MSCKGVVLRSGRGESPSNSRFLSGAQSGLLGESWPVPINPLGELSGDFAHACDGGIQLPVRPWLPGSFCGSDADIVRREDPAGSLQGTVVSFLSSSFATMYFFQLRCIRKSSATVG